MFFHITIQPEWDSETVSALNVSCSCDLQAKEGECLSSRITEIVTIPFCPFYDLVFSDDHGIIPFSVQDQDNVREQGPVKHSHFLSKRDTCGVISYSYKVMPRVQPEGYRSSPYFDLVSEKGGVNGTGTTFLIYPQDEYARTEFILNWDLSLLPCDSRGVCSLGAGSVVKRKNIKIQDILYSIYAVGLIRSIEKENTGFYWFDRMPLDAEKTADTVTKMFLYMSDKFNDKGGDYRIFARRNHFTGYGGTACTRSYIFGYSEDDMISGSALKSLLAHEMVHNWPTMSDDPSGRGTWYVEGSAEYYSIMVQLEMGIASVQELADEINEKAATYYENPYIHMDNMSLGKIYWKDLAAQRLPYARGLIYLSNLDAQIKRVSDFQKSLMDIELELLKIAEPTPEDFIRSGSDIAGFDLEPDFKAMCSGADLVPDPDGFAGMFEVRPCRVKVNKAAHRGDKEYTDEERDGYRWYVRS